MAAGATDSDTTPEENPLPVVSGIGPAIPAGGDATESGTSTAAATSAMAPESQRFGALRYRNFALLWGGLLLSNSGTWMQGTAQGYLVYQLTSSPLALGLLGFCTAVPMLLLPPFGGVVADRVDRLALLKVTNLAWIVMTLALAVVTWTGQVQFWHILLVAFLNATTLAFDNPTRQALVPDLVPRSELLSAISLNSVAFTGASLIGPALAGQLLAIFGQRLYQGTAIVFLFNALSYLAVLVPVLFWIRIPDRRRTGPPASVGADLLEGLRFVQSRRALVLLLLLTAVTSVFGRSFNQLMPVFAKDVLNVGPAGLGWMYSAPGAGTLLGGLTLAALKPGRSQGTMVAASTVIFTLAIFGFALSHHYALSLVMLFFTGLAGTVAGASIATLLQARSPGRLRGRVMSLQTLAIIGMGPLGGLFSGYLASRLAPPLAISLAAAVILIFLAGILLTQPAWRHLNTPEIADQDA